eukprot:229763-Prorocentrum_minimum.AAC.1
MSTLLCCSYTSTSIHERLNKGFTAAVSPVGPQRLRRGFESRRGGGGDGEAERRGTAPVGR